MGLYRPNGNRVTKTNITTAVVADPEVTITEDLYERVPYNDTDGDPNGGLLRLFCRAGKVLRQSQLDLLFPAAVIDSVSPASGGAAGGEIVTLTGKYLDGVSAVTFDGAAATNVTVVSATQVDVTTPAGVAGPADIVVTDDSGTTTVTGGYTYV